MRTTRTRSIPNVLPLARAIAFGVFREEHPSMWCPNDFFEFFSQNKDRFFQDAIEFHDLLHTYDVDRSPRDGSLPRLKPTLAGWKVKGHLWALAAAAFGHKPERIVITKRPPGAVIEVKPDENRAAIDELLQAARFTLPETFVVTVQASPRGA